MSEQSRRIVKEAADNIQTGAKYLEAGAEKLRKAGAGPDASKVTKIAKEAGEAGAEISKKVTEAGGSGG